MVVKIEETGAGSHAGGVLVHKHRQGSCRDRAVSRWNFFSLRPELIGHWMVPLLTIRNRELRDASVLSHRNPEPSRAPCQWMGGDDETRFEVQRARSHGHLAGQAPPGLRDFGELSLALWRKPEASKNVAGGRAKRHPRNPVVQHPPHPGGMPENGAAPHHVLSPLPG